MSPNAAIVAVLVNPNYPSAATEVEDLQNAASSLGLTVKIFNARNQADFEPVFDAVGNQRASALLVADDPFLESKRDLIVRLAGRRAIPAIYVFKGLR